MTSARSGRATLGVLALREKLSPPSPRLGVLCDGDLKLWPSTGGDDAADVRPLVFKKPPNERLRTSDDDLFGGVSRINIVTRRRYTFIAHCVNSGRSNGSLIPMRFDL